MIETGSKLSELAAQFKKYPQISSNIRVSSKPPLETIPGLATKVAEIEKQLGNSGRVLIRYSGTEQIARVMVEGPKRSSIKKCVDELTEIIRTAIGKEG